MEGTITQQTKLIDFLQSQAHGGSKKKKVPTHITNIRTNVYLYYPILYMCLLEIHFHELLPEELLCCLIMIIIS